MNKYSLDEVWLKATALSPIIRTIQSTAKLIVNKTTDSEVQKFLRLPVRYTKDDSFQCTFAQAVVLRSIDEAIYDNYGKGCTISISKKSLPIEDLFFHLLMK